MFTSLFAAGAIASAMIDTPAFKMELEGDWVQEQVQDKEQKSYYSKSLDTGLTTSYLMMNAKPSDTERIANKLIEFRLNGENAAANKFNLKMTIVEPILVPYSKGHQVAYYGHDSNNRQFRYLGVVMPDKTINIYTESKSKSQAELEVIFNNLIKGLKIE
ncbi:MAG: hypothetical protein KZQ84_19725 [Candidatus Thiodiazotropha sp. (ex Lucinoma borealis)]|nr:hypothetical protein [Candidatus Thiodiazotropha sp. (ex Lucinoma borealis)]